MRIINNLILKIKTSQYFKNLAVLVSGSIIAQLVVVICSPILTRVYSVEEIGIYTYILSISSIFTAVMNARYDMAIVSENDNEKVYSLVKLSFQVGMLVTFFVTIVFSIYFVFSKIEYIHYRYTLIFFALILLSNSLINILNSWNNRYKEYKLMSKMNIIRNSVQNIGAVLFGFLGTGFLGLILPYTIGQFLGIAEQAKSMKPYMSKIKEKKYAEEKAVLYKYKNFPLFSAPALFANNFSYSSITIFLESLYDLTTVGFYSMSTRILGLPLSLVSGNIAKVFFKEASEEYIKTGGYYRSFKKTLCLLTTLAIPFGIVMYYIAPWACSAFFGSEWWIAGLYIKIMVPFYMLRFIATSLSNGLAVTQHQKQELVFQLILAFTSVLAYLIVEVKNGSVEVFLVWVTVLKSLAYILLILMVFIDSYKNKINEVKTL